MSLARKILYSLCAAVLLLLMVGVFLPSTVHVARETTIDAPAATVFALVSDVHRMQEWSPWNDGAAVGEPMFSGPPRGPGASVQWRSTPKTSGRQTVIETSPFSSVVTEIELDGSGTFRSAFALDETDAGTRVVWTFDTDLGMHLFRRYLGAALARRIERYYEKGLADLESMAENLPRADFSELEVEHLVVAPTPMAYVTTSSEPSATAISEAMGAAFFEILRFIDRQGLTEAGAPLAISRDFHGSRLVFDAAVPLRGITPNTGESGDSVRIGESYGGPVIRATHIGSYAELSGTHEKIAAYLAAYGIERNGDAWESYESDPARTPESDLLTYVYYPVTEAPPN